MAVTLNANTSTGFIATSDTSGVLQLQTGGTTAVTVDASQNVGIGTSSPSKLLQVTNADRTVGSTQVLLEGSYNAYGTGISFQSRTSSGGTLVEMARIVADGEDNWNTTASTQDAGLRFYTTLNGGSAEKMRIASDGSVLVGGTGIGLNRLVSYGGFQSNSTQQFNIYCPSSSNDFEWVMRTGARQLYYVNNATVVASLSLTGVWTNASDVRYKENITDSQYGLATVMALKPRAYNLIDQADKPQIGFIAQEVLDVVPEVVDSVQQHASWKMATNSARRTVVKPDTMARLDWCACQCCSHLQRGVDKPSCRFKLSWKQTAL
jgi:hypothetical protein